MYLIRLSPHKLALKGDRYLETTLSIAVYSWGKTEIDFFSSVLGF